MSAVYHARSGPRAAQDGYAEQQPPPQHPPAAAAGDDPPTETAVNTRVVEPWPAGQSTGCSGSSNPRRTSHVRQR